MVNALPGLSKLQKAVAVVQLVLEGSTPGREMFTRIIQSSQMLLRRLTEHVKTQNWTAVAIDFVIVVVGVFIGIQVNGWNEERQLRLRESTYLALLREDVAAMKNNLEILTKRGRTGALKPLGTVRTLQ